MPRRLKRPARKAPPIATERHGRTASTPGPCGPLFHAGSYNRASMRFIVWPFRIFVFFALFAFALNNQQTVVVHWFFGVDWTAPLVIVVLIAFAVGCAIGVLAMVPSWWRQRRVARQALVAPPASPAPAPLNTGPPSGFGVEPPREVL